ncbi:unnamed protein product, partial [Prorocentrum cordatum]
PSRQAVRAAEGLQALRQDAPPPPVAAGAGQATRRAAAAAELVDRERNVAAQVR